MSAVKGIGMVVFVAMALAVAGCGGDEPERSVAIEQLAELCEAARLDIEALGSPADEGFEVLEPMARRGTKLATAVGKLEGADPKEQEQLTSLSHYLDEYYAGIALGAKIYKATKNREGYGLAVERAETFLTSAEALATRMGAPECAERPFGD